MAVKLSRNVVLLHIFFISLFLIVPTITAVRRPDEGFLEINQIFIQDTTANFVLLCFFYLNYYFLVPRFFLQRRYFLYITLVILFIAVAFTLPFLAGRIYAASDYARDQGFNPQPGGMRPISGVLNDRPPRSLSIVSFVIDEFRRHLYLFFTAVFVSFLLRTREHVAHLKEEKLNAELSSLKAQINPHFLFNTLNSIYSLTVKKDDRASDAIINLSGLMRYVLKDANQYSIPLEKEFEYVSNYIGLHKARLGDTIDLRYECTGDPKNMKIAPLILLTYIENAFKYGANPDMEDCRIEIILQATEEGVSLHTFNRKANSTNFENSTGIGIQNTAERLNLLYPKKHQLKIKDHPASYEVDLRLELV